MRGRQAGWSVVELMVGLTIGLIVVAGALALFAGHIGYSRRLLVEARLNQDLRAVAGLMARELRRAGYWEHALAGQGNPHAPMLAQAGDPAISYSLARDTANGRAADGVLQDDEQFGFKLDAGVLKMRLGGSWQPMTDLAVLTVNHFSVSPHETVLDIRDACPATCTAGAGCPTLTVRSYTLLLKGTATPDPGVSRVLQTTVRVRNDALQGHCA